MKQLSLSRKEIQCSLCLHQLISIREASASGNCLCYCNLKYASNQKCQVTDFIKPFCYLHDPSKVDRKCPRFFSYCEKKEKGGILASLLIGRYINYCSATITLAVTGPQI